MSENVSSDKNFVVLEILGGGAFRVTDRSEYDKSVRASRLSEILQPLIQQELLKEGSIFVRVEGLIRGSLKHPQSLSPEQYLVGTCNA